MYLTRHRGGTETLSKKIREYLDSKGSSIQYNKRVTAIRERIVPISFPRAYRRKKIPSDATKTRSDSGVIVVESDQKDNIKLDHQHMEVTVNGSQTEHYGHVISTIPLTVLRTIDLREAGLNTMQKNALRALDYGASTKIAVLFKSDWWYQKLGIVGGQSFTDLPLRTIVYPSYGVDSGTPSKVLIASYTWTTDASRLGALALGRERQVLKELVLRNLAEAHYGVNGNEEVDYDFLVNEYEDMHVKDWNIDEYAMGASCNANAILS